MAESKVEPLPKSQERGRFNGKEYDMVEDSGLMPESIMLDIGANRKCDYVNYN